MKIMKIMLCVILVMVAYGCGHECDLNQSRCELEITKMNGSTTRKAVVIPSRSNVYLTNDMVLFYTRSCNDEFKVSHDKGCVGKYYTGWFEMRGHGFRGGYTGTRIDMGVTAFRVISRQPIK